MRYLVVLVAVSSFTAAFTQGTLVPPDDWDRVRPWDTWQLDTHVVDVSIKDGVAQTRVEQVFFNPGRGSLEAEYLLPVPVGAAISQLSVIDGDKKQDAKILSAEEARRIYRQIVMNVRDPALLEYVGSRLVRFRLFPISPGQKRKVVISYSETLPRDGGAYRYSYSMKLDARSSQPPMQTLIRGTVETSQPIQTCYSPSHTDLSVRPTGSKSATFSWEGRRGEWPRDFQLFTRSGGDALGISVLPYRERGDGFFLLFLSPRLFDREAEIPKSVVFVFDRTGSMDGEKIKQAKEALRHCIQQLRPMDRFEVITFNDGTDPLFGHPLEASQENIRKALRFADLVEARGGTNIQDALKLGLSTLDKESANRFRALVFLTDGLPTVGETDPKRIARTVSDSNEGKDRIRIYNFGVGRDVDSRLLDRLATDSGGDSNYVTEGEAIGPVVKGFFEKVTTPALSNVAIKMDGLDSYDVFPKTMRDLFRGSAIVLAGRYRGEKGRIVVTGQGAGGLETTFIDVDFSGRQDRHDYVPRIWAARKIGYLIDELKPGTESKEVQDEIVRLSLEYGIITPLTSFLITENAQTPPTWRVRRAGGEDLRLGDGHFSSDTLDQGAHDYVGRVAQSKQEVLGGAGPGAASEGLKKSGGGGIGPSGANRSYELKGPTVMYGESIPITWMALARQSGDKTFYTVKGIYTDGALKPEAKLRKIKAFSDAHLALIQKDKKVAGYSSLASEIIIQLPGGAIFIGAEGDETLSPTEVDRLLGK